MAEGLGEPVTLHPVLDPNRCISIGACVSACPEGDILAMVNGNPVLVGPDRCIGHGACVAVCPVDAITLVFGTASRGVEIPHVKETFETNVDGIYIAGELGGMGLIRNAVTQGKQAIENMARTLRKKDDSSYDVVIVGAGPAGLSATLEAKHQGLRYVTIDQDDIGGTILTYPRQKIVMTQPAVLPLYGKTRFREISKEDLLAFFRTVISDTGVAIQRNEKLISIAKNGAFELTTSKGRYTSKRVLLAIGRRGSPRKLGVPGEESAKVTYALTEPEQYRRSRVLVVGGGDSAIEAATALAGEDGTDVTLTYRGNAFSRVKPKNRARIDEAVQGERVRVLLESHVEQIDKESVTLRVGGSETVIPNDYVLVFAGGELPTALLKSVGIRVDMKFGER